MSWKRFFPRPCITSLGGEPPCRTNTRCACQAQPCWVWDWYSKIKNLCLWASCQERTSPNRDGRGGGTVLEQTRWSHSKATPHVLVFSQLVRHQTICGPVYPQAEVVMQNCACACALDIMIIPSDIQNMLIKFQTETKILFFFFFFWYRLTQFVTAAQTVKTRSVLIL